MREKIVSRITKIMGKFQFINSESDFHFRKPAKKQQKTESAKPVRPRGKPMQSAPPVVHHYGGPPPMIRGPPPSFVHNQPPPAVFTLHSFFF